MRLPEEASGAGCRGTPRVGCCEPALLATPAAAPVGGLEGATCSAGLQLATVTWCLEELRVRGTGAVGAAASAGAQSVADKRSAVGARRIGPGPCAALGFGSNLGE
jgi:hypothetical protein